MLDNVRFSIPRSSTMLCKDGDHSSCKGYGYVARHGRPKVKQEERFSVIVLGFIRCFLPPQIKLYSQTIGDESFESHCQVLKMIRELRAP